MLLVKFNIDLPYQKVRQNRDSIANIPVNTSRSLSETRFGYSMRKGDWDDHDAPLLLRMLFF